MVKIVSVKFKGGGKLYYFAPGKLEYAKGMGVIVETANGREYAEVVQPVAEVDESELVAPLKPVIRIADERDMQQLKHNEERKGEAMQIVREKIAERGLPMKPVGIEFAFDGNKVTVYFTAENRVDFRELIKDLSSAFHMRIELRQIGIRDEIKLIGGLAPCGRECCCVRALQEPKKVSVKMAKTQNISLNPGKISGLCGRLMCCLAYENDYYADVSKRVPKIGSEVDTPDGKGVAINVNMLSMVVKVRIEKGEAMSFREYPVEKISFTRGNEVFTATEDSAEDEADILVGDEEVVPEPAHKQNGAGERKERDRRENRNKGNKGNGNNGNANNKNSGDDGNGNNKGNGANRGDGKGNNRRPDKNRPHTDKAENANNAQKTVKPDEAHTDNAGEKRQFNGGRKRNAHRGRQNPAHPASDSAPKNNA